MRSILPYGCLPLLVFGVLLVIPFLIANVTVAALSRLGLSPQVTVLAAVGIFVGGLINIPVKRIQIERPVKLEVPTLFGLSQFELGRVYERGSMTIAVNVGGCLIPTGIAVYEIIRIVELGPTGLAAVTGAVLINVGVCYWLARPVPEAGIALPALVPALTAAVSALIFLPDFAPPVAFTAGVLGPLIGADLLHIDDIKEIGAGAASIGGAGTFDGIVLSGLVATLLA